jgi:hypothetical protein
VSIGTRAATHRIWSAEDRYVEAFRVTNLALKGRASYRSAVRLDSQAIPGIPPVELMSSLRSFFATFRSPSKIEPQLVHPFPKNLPGTLRLKGRVLAQFGRIEHFSS